MGFWGSVSCSCFHGFYFVACFMLLVSCLISCIHALRLVRLHAAAQRLAAAWQKQCILGRTFVRLWSALQPPYDYMCHQSIARAKRDQPLRSGTTVGQNWLQEHTRGVLRAYSNNSVLIMFPNLCINNVNRFFVYVALLSLVILIKNTNKSLYTPTLLVFN